MATRVPESTQVEARTNIQMKSQRLVRKNTSFSIAGELESCASNDIPLQFESISEEETEDLQREKSISKRKSAPSYKTQRRHNRVKKINTKSIQVLIHVKPLLRGSCLFCSFRQRKKTCNNKLRRPRQHQ